MLERVYISNQSHYIYHYINCICVIKPRVSVIPHPLSVFHHTLYVWHNIQYACYHNNCLGHYTPICITSHPVYLWHHIQYVRYDHTAFMKTQWLYWTSPPPYLTSQPLYPCHHTDGTHICIGISLYWWHHNKCLSLHTSHTYDIITNLHPITFTLYDMNDHVLWHHIQGIHDIRSSLYDIISTL